MGRVVSGGTTGGSIFTTNKTGTGSYGAALYIDLGLIPTGFRIWFGSGQYSSSKSGTFELRTSKLTKSAGNDTDTTLLGSISASSKTGTVTQDYYKSGTLHTVSVTSTGVEKFWIKAKSTTATSGTYYYSLNYTVE
jgi:hypothetical protein